MSKDEETFVLLAAAGDDNAFRELVRLTEGSALATAERYLRNHAKAQDAAQDTYVELYNALPRLREPGSFRFFFRRILLKHCDRHRRKHWREEGVEDPESFRGDSSVQANSSALDDPWGGALDGLSEEEHRIFLLRCTEGYTYAQLASLLNLSVHTITNRLNAARRKIRQHLTLMNENDRPETPPDPEFIERVIAIIQPSCLASEERQGPGNCRGVDTWEMICAAIRGDTPTIRRLLKLDRNLAITEYWYTQPIHFTVREGHVEATRTLVEAGADPNHLRHAGSDLVDTARDRGHTAVAEYLESVRSVRNLALGEDRPVHVAARAGNAEALEKEIGNDTSVVEAPDSHGNRPLHLAVASGNLETVNLLLDAGADIDAVQVGMHNYGASGFRPVHLALWRSTFFTPCGDLKMLEFLLTRGALCTASIAAVRGDLPALRSIVEHDPDAVNAAETCGRRPLSCAAELGHADIVEWLLENGADPNRPEGRFAPRGMALYLAARNGDEKIVSMLLDRGADPNAFLDSSGCALFIAKAPAIRRLLILRGAHVDPGLMVWTGNIEGLAALAAYAPDILEKSAGDLLTATVKEDHEDLFHWFLRLGIRVPKSLTGCRSYLWSRPRYTRILLEHGMDPNLPDWQRSTPLHVLCTQIGGGPHPHRIELAVMFKEFGADLNAIDEEYRSTPLAWAARSNLPDMVQWLLDNGADPDLAAEPWAHPLRWAERRGHAEIVAMLSK